MSILALGLSPRTWPIPFVGDLWATMTASLLSEVFSSVVLILLLMILQRSARRARARRRREGRLLPREAPGLEARGGSPDDILGDLTDNSSTEMYQCEACSAVVGPYDRNCSRCGASFA
jgi:hypothetical protein